MKKSVLFFSFLLLVCLLPINTFGEECIKGDCKNGLGTFITDNGNKYVAEFKDAIGSLLMNKIKDSVEIQKHQVAANFMNDIEDSQDEDI